MTKKYLMKIRRVDGVNQGYWVTKEKAKIHARHELWKDGTLRRVARNKKGHFITWKIVKIKRPPPIPPPPPPPEEYYTYRVDFDIRFDKES